MRNRAMVSSGSGTQAIQAPLASTGTGRPSMLRLAGAVPPRIAPKRKDESHAWMTPVESG